MEFFNFNNFFNWSRIVDPAPTGDWKFMWWVVGICAAAIILGIVRVFLPGDLFLKRRIEGWLWTFGVLGLMLTFFRWQQIPYFSARLLWLALLIWLFIWAILICYYRLVKLPKKILAKKVEERKKKYL